MLEVRGVRAGYEGLEVLHGIDLDVRRGEVVCLLGNNAAGKTTLVNVILGLVPVTTGTVTFLDQRVDGWPPDRIIGCGIAVVPENGQVFTGLTVLENLRMGLYSKRGHHDGAAAIRRVFALYPILEERQRQIAGLLSGGSGRCWPSPARWCPTRACSSWTRPRWASRRATSISSSGPSGRSIGSRA